MLAYVFSHLPAPDVDRATDEDALHARKALELPSEMLPEVLTRTPI